MDVLYRVREGRSRTFLDFFWVPRVPRPACRAEEEVGNRNHQSFDTYGIAFVARGEVIISTGCFHICISGFYGQTEGDFHDLFWVVLRFFLI